MDSSDFPSGWKPAPGDSIEGKIVDLDVRHGEYDPYPVVTLETSRGAVAVHACHEVLRNELARRFSARSAIGRASFIRRGCQRTCRGLRPCCQ
jgi:hypothetical protein